MTATDTEKYNIYRILEVLVLIFLGVLIEYKRVIFAFKNKISINKYYFITGVALVIFVVLPYGFMAQFGVAHLGSIKGTIFLVLINLKTRSILSILAGIFLARSLSAFESNKQIS